MPAPPRYPGPKLPDCHAVTIALGKAEHAILRQFLDVCRTALETDRALLSRQQELEDALGRASLALGGPEWCCRVPTPPPGESGDLCQDVPILAEEAAARIAELEKTLREAEDARDQARAIAEAGLPFTMRRCHACGHRLSRAADHCSRCQTEAVAPWRLPPEFPDRCTCDRCRAARQAATAQAEGGPA